MAKQVKKEAITINELHSFGILPYEGKENYALESETIDEFVKLMSQKGYSKEELTTVWDVVRKLKLEAAERGSQEGFKYEDDGNKPIPINEVRFELAVCGLFKKLDVNEMKKYYCTWFEAVDKFALAQKELEQKEEVA